MGNGEMDPFQRGLTLAQGGDLRGAIAEFDAAIAAAPNRAVAYYRRGLARFDCGEVAPAAFDYSKALELDPSLAEAWRARALARMVLKHFDGAIADLDHLKPLQGDRAGDWELRAAILRKQGLLTAAIAALRRAADLYIEGRDTDGARRCVALLDQLKPKPAQPPSPKPFQSPNPAQASTSMATPLPSPRAIYSQLLARVEAGERTAVLRELDWAVQVDPDDGDARLCRGVVRTKLGDYPGAIADLNHLLRQDPNRAEGYRNRAKARLALGDRAGAMADLDRAAAAGDQDPLLHVARGEVLQASGQYVEAIAAYGKAIEADPACAIAHLGRASSFVRLEDLKAATEDYQRAASIFCDREAWDDYKSTLELLKNLTSSNGPSPRPLRGSAAPDLAPLRQRLRMLVGGHWEIAERLLNQARFDYPQQEEIWYLAKVIDDLERDRGLDA
jgi:tetratricopeptide (TPR) repeat protein